jgi:pimeloyl-ACP methyl ester carboxylesterase
VTSGGDHRDRASVDRYGTPGGPLVIALHGAVANRKTWLPLANVLPPHFELWCPDLPGHGARRDETFTREAALETVAALLALARPRRVVLAGDSLGGYLALEAGARIPHGIGGIVAGGCTWSMTGFGGVLARASDLPPRLLERVLGEARLEALGLALLRRLVDGECAAAVASAGLRLRARSESLEELRGIDLAHMVAQIRVPIAFVNGVNDWPTRAGEGAFLAAAHDAERVIAPGVGHGVGIFAPGTFAIAIGNVVGRLTRLDRRPVPAS